MWKFISNSSLVTALMVLTVTATPAWALDWHDSEWSGLGCPSKLSGDWVPLTHSPYAGSKIEFKSNSAALSSKGNNPVFFTFTSNAKDEPYFILERLPEDVVSFPGYIKIRPHIAVQSVSEGKKYTLCKIKVFLFETKQKADQMSYLGWDIYSTLNTLEVARGN